MKTTNDILDSIYKIINIASVKGTLDGAIYRDTISTNVEKGQARTRDIVIHSLPLSSEKDAAVQDCVVIVNSYAPDLANGQRDIIHIKATGTAVRSVIDNYNSGNNYLHLEIMSDALMPDLDRKGYSFQSFRITAIIQSI